jgi:hypothetical protein
MNSFSLVKGLGRRSKNQAQPFCSLNLFFPFLSLHTGKWFHFPVRKEKREGPCCDTRWEPEPGFPSTALIILHSSLYLHPKLKENPCFTWHGLERVPVPGWASCWQLGPHSTVCPVESRPSGANCHLFPKLPILFLWSSHILPYHHSHVTSLEGLSVPQTPKVLFIDLCTNSP